MTELIAGRDFLTATYPPRWLALKFLENDLVVRQLFEADAELHRRMRDMAEDVAQHCEKTLKTQPEFIVADYRYGYISSILRQGVLTIVPDLQGRADLSDKIDSVLTHQVAGPTIMLCILYGLFSLTFSIGQVPMGWAGLRAPRRSVQIADRGWNHRRCGWGAGFRAADPDHVYGHHFS